ncbi:hypothetical protein CYMTET_33194 [Cymbomonas tetramitiformis]|uniref:Uncharacterized protein n=1 Tax=Cymbomonas tetramitiformis TaxID=36881 RepID=A0AAE0KR79_9CHLO|nr:hypothetical protein CYMTET_33194 [Cymbomonas tetramitiformis]
MQHHFSSPPLGALDTSALASTRRAGHKRTRLHAARWTQAHSPPRGALDTSALASICHVDQKEQCRQAVLLRTFLRTPTEAAKQHRLQLSPYSRTLLAATPFDLSAVSVVESMCLLTAA